MYCNRLEEFVCTGGPKRDCLEHILEYISAIDMLHVSRSMRAAATGALLLDMCRERIIGRQSIDFCRMPLPRSVWKESIERVFLEFGSKMRDAKVRNIFISKIHNI